MRLALLALSVTLLAGCGHFKTEEAAEAAPTAEMSRPVAAAGETCSGIAGIPCAEGLACIFEEGACYQTADAAGTCKSPPEVCITLLAPICGCDGKTYGNSCFARREGVSVAFKGACPPTDS